MSATWAVLGILHGRYGCGPGLVRGGYGREYIQHVRDRREAASQATDRTEGIVEVVCDTVTSRVGLHRFKLFYAELDGNTDLYGVHSGYFEGDT